MRQFVYFDFLDQDIIDLVRIRQTQHLVLDTKRAHDTSAKIEAEKIQAAAERLQQKEVLSKVGEVMYRASKIFTDNY